MVLVEEVKEKEKKDKCCCDGSHECECHDKKKDKSQGKIDKLKKELEEKNKKIMELEDKVKYSQAEIINYRKRKEEEVSTRLKFANQELISELIIILDNFERAIRLDDNNLNDELSKFLKGFKMMYASFDELLKKHGLEEIPAYHKMYDANTMEALMTDSDPDYEDDEVLEVLLKGYKLKGRVIRPASVRVNKLEENDKGEDNNE